jgi:hypothetical protein
VADGVLVSDGGMRASAPATWTDRLILLPERLPGPTDLWYPAIGAVLVVINHVLIWAAGVLPVGTFEIDLAVPIVFTMLVAWLLLVLSRVARSAFRDFRPALAVDPDVAAIYEHQVTSVPDRAALLAVVVFEAVVFTGYFGSVRPLRPALPIGVELVTGPFWALAAAELAVLLLQAGRQLRVVSQLSLVARNVDIFKPAPVNALSRLPAVSSIMILVFVALNIVVIPEQPSVYIAEEVFAMALGVATFIVPLRGMHGRLLTEKNRLVAEAQDRLKLTLGRVHEAVEANDLSTADQLNKTLSSVLAERDVLLKLPTWPWSVGTFRGVASALLLPVAIFLITRLIDRLL